MTTILIVEDNEMNRDMLSRRLERKGYKVLIAVDGEQGLAVARANAPDLVLMDMSLPVVDGWEATRRLKADERLKHTPVVALTAHAMANDRDKALADQRSKEEIEAPKREQDQKDKESSNARTLKQAGEKGRTLAGTNLRQSGRHRSALGGKAARLRRYQAPARPLSIQFRNVLILVFFDEHSQHVHE